MNDSEQHQFLSRAHLQPDSDQTQYLTAEISHLFKIHQTSHTDTLNFERCTLNFRPAVLRLELFGKSTDEGS